MLQKLTGLAVAGLCLVMAGAQAQPVSTGATPPYPQRPIRMIAAQSAGSSLDTI